MHIPAWMNGVPLDLGAFGITAILAWLGYRKEPPGGPRKRILASILLVTLAGGSISYLQSLAQELRLSTVEPESIRIDISLRHPGEHEHECFVPFDSLTPEMRAVFDNEIQLELHDQSQGGQLVLSGSFSAHGQGASRRTDGDYLILKAASLSAPRSLMPFQSKRMADYLVMVRLPHASMQVESFLLILPRSHPIKGTVRRAADSSGTDWVVTELGGET